MKKKIKGLSGDYDGNVSMPWPAFWKYGAVAKVLHKIRNNFSFHTGAILMAKITHEDMTNIIGNTIDYRNKCRKWAGFRPRNPTLEIHNDGFLVVRDVDPVPLSPEAKARMAKYMEEHLRSADNELLRLDYDGDELNVLYVQNVDHSIDFFGFKIHPTEMIALYICTILLITTLSILV